MMTVLVAKPENVTTNGKYMVTVSVVQVDVPYYGVIIRTHIITVGDETARYGDHCDSGEVNFTVVHGRATLYTGSVQDLASLTSQEVSVGCTIYVPPFVAFTFVCDPGTVLVATYNRTFRPESVTICRLEIPGASDV